MLCCGQAHLAGACWLPLRHKQYLLLAMVAIDGHSTTGVRLRLHEAHDPTLDAPTA